MRNYWGTLHGGVHHDRNATRVEAYRRGMEAIRRGAGNAFILGCNHPLWPSLGLIHGSRSSMDVSRDWHHIAKTGRENLLRGWQNGRLWWNDPDALCLNAQVLAEVPDAAGVTRSIGQASQDEFLFHATLVYATGGMLLAGDDLRTYGDLEKQRLDILLPPTGRAMRFADDQFEIGRLTLPDAEMVAVLNWKDVPQDIALPLPERVRVTELWSGQDLGVQEGHLKWGAVSPHSGRLLRLVPVDRAGEGRLTREVVLLAGLLTGGCAWPMSGAVVDLRAVLVETNNSIGIEYRTADRLVGRSTECAPAGVELKLPGAEWAPVRFHQRTERESAIELGPRKIGPLTLRWRLVRSAFARGTDARGQGGRRAAVHDRLSVRSGGPG